MKWNFLALCVDTKSQINSFYRPESRKLCKKYTFSEFSYSRHTSYSLTILKKSNVCHCRDSFNTPLKDAFKWILMRYFQAQLSKFGNMIPFHNPVEMICGLLGTTNEQSDDPERLGCIHINDSSTHSSHYSYYKCSIQLHHTIRTIWLHFTRVVWSIYLGVCCGLGGKLLLPWFIAAAIPGIARLFAELTRLIPWLIPWLIISLKLCRCCSMIGRG